MVDTNAITTSFKIISSSMMFEEFDVNLGQEVVCSNPHSRVVTLIDVTNASEFCVSFDSATHLTMQALETALKQLNNEKGYLEIDATATWGSRENHVSVSLTWSIQILQSIIHLLI